MVTVILQLCNEGGNSCKNDRFCAKKGGIPLVWDNLVYRLCEGRALRLNENGDCNNVALLYGMK